MKDAFEQIDEEQEALMDQIDIIAVGEAMADYEINGGTPWETVLAEMEQVVAQKPAPQPSNLAT